MPLQATSGAASYDAFGGGPPAAKINYIEDFFQSYLRTGTGASATITTGLDGSTKETLVWTKSRSAATNHKLTDNVRGVTKALSSNTTGAEATDSQGLTAFSATGYTIGTNTDYNNSGATYVDWQWVAQPKFFDIVTWTGNGTGNRSIPHLLNSTPAFIQTKQTNGTEGWWNHHRSVTSPNANWWRNYGVLSSVNSFDDWGDNSGLYQAPDANNLYIGSYYNESGKTYIAYLFAHDAGGFGLTGTDNVISCSSFTTDGSGNATVSLGYEPQWVLIKLRAGAQDWILLDNMRGMSQTSDNYLFPNLTSAEGVWNPAGLIPTATGFNCANAVLNSSATYIYIAIRRGPMKVPTTGTSVFATVARTGTGAAATVTAGFPVDMYLMQRRPNHFPNIVDRLRGNTKNIQTYQTDAEATNSNTITGFDNMTAVPVGADTDGYVNESAVTYVNQMFKRAPSFMDVVCYTGTGSATTQTHNLGAVPELMLVKRRSAANAWAVYANNDNTDYLVLNTTAATADDATYWNDTSPTSSVFSVGTNNAVNASASTYVAYLFATCAGVSKVGSYTGNGTTKQIDCGFTAGARFVLIKRTDSTGDWYLWDTARGIVSGNDPYLLLNSTAAEVTSTDYIDTYSAGFEISSTAPAAINASGGSFIFLAIS